MKEVPAGIIAPTPQQVNGDVRVSTDVAQQKEKLPPMYDPVGQAAQMEQADREKVKTVKFFD